MSVKITGITEDKKYVVDFFYLLDEKGIPLETIIEALKEKNLMPDWTSFYIHGRRVGWNHGTIVGKLSRVVLDLYGTEWHTIWLNKMNSMTNQYKSLTKENIFPI